MLRIIISTFLLAGTLHVMAQQWVNELFIDSQTSTDKWIEMYCTDKFKRMLKDEYSDLYDGDGMATWLLEGFVPGEDKVIQFALAEELSDKAGFDGRVAIHFDVFAPDQMQLYSRRTVIFDMKEQDGIQMVDSVECPYDSDGTPKETVIQRKEQKMPQALQALRQRVQEGYNFHLFSDCMDSEPESAHCMRITRKTMEPATGLAVQQMMMHGVQRTAEESEKRGGMLRCVNAITYHPQAESLRTEYETVIYESSAQGAVTPLCHFSISTLYLDGQDLTLEQTLYFDPQGQLLHAERHLIGLKGKETAIKPNTPLSDGKRELQRASRLVSAYAALMDEDK